MKFVEEFQDPDKVQQLAKTLRQSVARPWTIMEICGGQTHNLIRFGLDALLPPQVTLVHGPGCPVCVTPTSMIDAAIALSSRSGVILCSFGDMLRVPGSSTDLLRAKASGSDVRMVYSPMDVLNIAKTHPEKQVVFFSVGFETTAPASALAVRQAAKQGLENFSMLVSHVLVPPAMEAILSAPDNLVQGFLAAGHVCTVMGLAEYEPLALKYKTPIIVTGFEPVDLMQGILSCILQLEKGQHHLENQYSRSVRPEGNLAAMKLLDEVFEPVDREWRGLGIIPASGWRLRPLYQAFDAQARFGLHLSDLEPKTECIAGLILQGRKKPMECPAFGTRCTPQNPMGAPMVSSEGACAAYYQYRSGA